MTAEVSIVMGARGRPIETARTLLSYAQLKYPSWELVFMNVIGRGVWPLDKIADKFKDRLPIKYHLVTEEECHTPAMTWNTGFMRSEGRFVITCSADILVTAPDMIEKYLEQYNNVRLSTLTYHLTRIMTEDLDVADWYNNPNSVQSMPGFWWKEIDGERNEDRLAAGLTTYQTGMSRERWEWFGKFRTEYSHLANDQDVVLREKALGVGCDTLQGYCGYHQAHPPMEQTEKFTPFEAGGWIYENERQARLLEPAKKEYPIIQ